tara:strand:- start:858 stop:1091 length:234 start_codon:yes stop_codon:yes gene_type:complete
MKYLNILTGENIVEGIIASISIVLTYYVLRNNFKFSKPMASMAGWFITWALRKFSVNLYRFIGQRYGMKLQPLRVSI